MDKVTSGLIRMCPSCSHVAYMHQGSLHVCVRLFEGRGWHLHACEVQWACSCPQHYALLGYAATAAASVTMCAGNVAGVQHFESHLATFREHLEVEVSRLTAAAQQLTELQGWWEDPQQVAQQCQGLSTLAVPAHKSHL